MPWVYLLECGDGSLYAGSTIDLERRLAEHQAGRGSRYTASHRPVRLVFAAECDTLSEAMRREAEIKRWPRRKKAALGVGREQQANSAAVGSPDRAQ